MDKMTSQDIEDRKRMLFEAMSERRRNHITERVGYEKWNPFEAPKDPIDIRRDQTRRTTQQLVREFLHTRTMDGYSNSYGSGVLEMCIGLMNDDDRYRAMFEFACWYREQLNLEKQSR